jgi:hypothetical protein
MIRTRAVLTTVVLVVAGTLVPAVAWADDAPPSVPADPPPGPVAVPPLPSAPLQVPQGGPDFPTGPVTGPLDPSTQSVHVVVPFTPVDPPHDLVILPGGRNATTTGSSPSTSEADRSAAPVTASAVGVVSPDLARVLLLNNGHPFAWNLWQAEGRTVTFARGVGRIPRHRSGSGTDGGGGL